MGRPPRPTIYALSTAAGRAGLAVVRLSGPGAGPALLALSGRVALPAPRRATRARLCDPAGGAPLDEALALWFPGPASFTGEDVAELHLHGSRAVVAGVLAALGRLPGLRLAEPGEFARRAFDAGKLDLAAVEGLADLIAAETGAQARQALAQLSGALGRRAEAWRERLLRLLAHAEAEIDFPDEEGVPGGLIAALGPQIRALAVEIAALLADGRRGERLRAGLSLAIIGPPNAGKSSLLNWLAGREAAIVAAQAGTTRDVVEVALDLGGLPVTAADTAGLRELDAAERASPHGAIEAEGMRRARARAEAADLKLLLLDATAPPDPALAALVDADTVVAVNKADLAPVALAAFAGAPVLAVSVRSGAGLPGLMARLEAEAAARLGAADGAAPLVTRARHREALAETEAALSRALAAPAPELLAEDLRLAARALGRIAGRVGVEDVLDRVFREFCIGK